MAYFDWNATAPLLPEAREAWLAAQRDYWANASTSYRLGVRARLALDKAREEMAGFAGCAAEQVIFTSGATEANNGLIREAARRSNGRDAIWISAIEHPSVREAAFTYWGEKRVETIPVLPDGRVDPDWMEDRLKIREPALVSVMAANNETGVVQPWPEILELCRARGVNFHCDAVQWFGKETAMIGSGWAAMTLSGHKFGGPKGVGCLILPDAWKGIKIQAGGAQEQDMRAGTENIPAILAMVAALRKRKMTPIPEACRNARQRFEEALSLHWDREIVIHGSGTNRLWNTCSLSLPEFRSERWIFQLDRLGYQVSSGSACSTGKSGPSPVLQAMGVGADRIRRAVRISSGWETVPSDWQALFEALIEVRRILTEAGPPTGPGTVIEI